MDLTGGGAKLKALFWKQRQRFLRSTEHYMVVLDSGRKNAYG